MKLLTAILVMASLLTIHAQQLGEIVENDESIDFPPNSIGGDIMFGEGGIGAGFFYKREISEHVTMFGDFSISEAKADNEIEYIDYWSGQRIVPNKVNRIFLIPVNLGIQYRLFRKTLEDNLRPYIGFGAGPSLVLTTPYDKEFFNAFGSAQAHYTLGGYIGLGANFGINKSSLVGLSIRYYVIHFFDKGVQSLENQYMKNLGGIYVTINLGTMY